MEDLIFWKLLYRLYPENEMFFWKSYSFDSLIDLGNAMLREVRADNRREYLLLFEDIISKKLVSTYLEITGLGKGLQKATSGIEMIFLDNAADEREKRKLIYLMGYMLSDKKDLFIDNVVINDLDGLSKHLLTLINSDYNRFEKLCKNLVGENNVLDVQFEAWLIANGKRDEIKKWEIQLKG